MPLLRTHTWMMTKGQNYKLDQRLRFDFESCRTMKNFWRSLQRMSLQRISLYGVFIFLLSLVFYTWFLPCENTYNTRRMSPGNGFEKYDKNLPIIFIGGVPRSGTTLMRAMLDAHPDVRCGEETRVIPRLLGMRTQWAKSSKESKRLIEAGLSDEVIDSALTAFILEIIVKHGEPAPRLCNKDPFTLKSTMYLSRLFPNSKYILMIRDGRAVVHSIITRKVTISGFDLRSYRNCLEKWNQAIESMYYQCLRVGPERCMPVYYEQMVLHPEFWLRRVLTFLDIEWHDSVLHHEDFVGKPGGISLSKTERSTDQVIKPVNMDALTKWVDVVPPDVKQDMHKIAPMLQRLGYDPDGYPPNYGKPDKAVADNTLFVKNNEDYWNKKLDLLNITLAAKEDFQKLIKENLNSQNVRPVVDTNNNIGQTPVADSVAEANSRIKFKER